ncbi:MAG: hypothetical protein LBG64_01210 [Pseudomonadales bacterium]|jgi:UDP-N-acetylmuramoyl-tripeptide--D-alanyl-D-alanine ligase|nr:hypothetical protein [Pseudomonadales bacterium]
MESLKKALFFWVAGYFRFFAKIRLKKWSPKIILVTGSSGKTTLFHMLEAQFGDMAYYSHHANSAFGIPFNILGLYRQNYKAYEYLVFLLKAPLMAFKTNERQKIYIVEADCDRPGEGKFLASFLRPNYTLWLNATYTHSMNFDEVVQKGKFNDVLDAITYEFGQFALYTRDVVLANGDSKTIDNFIAKHELTASIEYYQVEDHLYGYDLSAKGTTFEFKNEKVLVPYLMPDEVWCSVAMCQQMAKIFKIRFDDNFSKMYLPPGRSGLFIGVKNTLLIDSTYNASYDSMRVMLEMLEHMEGGKKWVVLGDMLEQGNETAQEHARLASLVADMDLERIMLVGAQMKKYAYPILQNKAGSDVVSVDRPSELEKYMDDHLQGGEIILFKGGRFLDGLLERLLVNQEQASLLPRRESYWYPIRAKHY